MLNLNRISFILIITINLLLANTLSLSDNGDGTWDVGYTADEPIGGFQFNVDGASVNGASGGDATANGFMISASSTTVLGFSLTGGTIAPGEGTLLVLDLNGEPTGLSGIVVSDQFGSALDFTYEESSSISGCTDMNACNYDGEATEDDGSCFYAEENYDCNGNCTAGEDCTGECGGDAVVDECDVCDGDGSSCSDTYYTVDLEDTGESQLTIFSDSISSLSVGDEVGVFDLEAITNYNDCSNQIDELLVGAGVWDGSQLNIVSTGSVDLCAFGGPQLAGFVEGNDVVVRVYKADEGVEYDTELSWGVGTGSFGEVIQQVSEITLVDGSVCEDDNDATAAFGGCAGAVAALGCDFVFGGSAISELCPETCGECGDETVVGCTDMDACNYDGEATEDDGSCEYAEENFDCNGNCVVEIDCAGECAGDAVVDECGICDGNNSAMDCNGDCFGDAAVDDCGICDGNNSAMDCNGDCFGDAVVDDCGVCNGSNDCADCAGTPNGNAYLDECGVCDDDSSNDCVQDCTGEWGGDAVIDECDVCDGPGAIYECGCEDLPESGGVGDEANSLWFIDNNNGNWSIGFNSDNAIGGFQFNVDGASVNSASGGEAAANGFMVSSSATTVLGFSLTGGTIPAQDGGILLNLELSGEPTGLSGIVVSDSFGSALDFSYDDGDGGDVACDCDGNVLDECGVCGGPGEIYECGCEDITEGSCDCDGNVLDECGECGGDGIGDGECDCDGNVDLGCGCGEAPPEMYYQDNDGDGLGSGEGDYFCEGDVPEGWVDNNNDDDDACAGIIDECGICDGDGPSDWCQDTDGDGLGAGMAIESCDAPPGWVEDCSDPEPDCATNDTDECGECGGDGIGDGECDCEGNVEDCAGECGGDALDLGCGCDAPPAGECGCDWSIVDLGCGCGEDGPSGCDETCGSDLVFDDCGECGGDNSSCSGCTDPVAYNYDEDATIDDGSCLYPDNYPDWSVNLGDYDFDASITSAVYSEDDNLGDEGDILAAFSGDEVRGIANAVELVEGEVPPGADIGTYIFFLTVGSDDNGENLTFKFYDVSEDAVLDLSETIEFTADASYGNVIDPVELHISDGLDPNYYIVDLEDTGESQLTIFSDSISSLSVGDEVGISDNNSSTNF